MFVFIIWTIIKKTKMSMFNYDTYMMNLREPQLLTQDAMKLNGRQLRFKD